MDHTACSSGSGRTPMPGGQGSQKTRQWVNRDPRWRVLMLRYLATFPESWYWQKWRDA